MKYWIVILSVALTFNASAIERKTKYNEAEIKQTCEKYKKLLLVSIDEIVSNPSKPTFDNTVVATENAIAKYQTGIGFPVFMSNAGPECLDCEKDPNDPDKFIPDLKAVEAAKACDEDSDITIKNVFIRTDFYKRFQAVKKSGVLATLSATDQRLFDNYERSFSSYGLNVSDPVKRKEISELLDAITKNEADFQFNTNQSVKKIEFSKEEMAGVPDSWMASRENKEKPGFYTLTTNTPDYSPFMKYSTNEDARRRFYLLYGTRGDQKNVDILEDTLRKRHRLANLLGFKSFSDRTFAQSNRMANQTQQVRKFLNDIYEGIKPGVLKDLNTMIGLK